MKSQDKSLFGSDFRGVRTIREFYAFYVGSRLPETNADWLAIPDHYLAEATNGRVFDDPLGEFTRIRREIASGMPRDVRLKKIAARCALMAQSGQYNYSRCLAHGEEGAALLALSEFVKNADKWYNFIIYG